MATEQQDLVWPTGSGRVSDLYLPSIHPSIHPPIHPSIHPSIQPSIQTTNQPTDFLALLYSLEMTLDTGNCNMVI